MKKMLLIVAVVVVGIAIGYFTVGNPLGQLLKLTIEKIGPEMMQAEVSVSDVNISAKDGSGRMSGLRVGNPKGFKTDHALTAGTIEIVIEPASLAQDVFVIHKVLIDAPNIIYEKGDNGSNFDAIQRNVEAYIGAGGKTGKSDKGESKKMIIDSLIIRNAKVNYNGMVDLSLPDIELHNIGKKSGGATAAQVTKAIIAELNTKLVLALAKSAVVTGVGGAALGAGMAIKGLLSK